MKNICFITFLVSNLIANAQTISTPELFNDQLNAFLNVRDFSISNTNNEAYFTIQSPDQNISQLVSIVKDNETWSTPVLLSFCDSFNYMEPFLTPDGTRLFFVSDRPLIQGGKRKDFDIWYVERQSTKAPWSQPKNPGPTVNSLNNEFYPTVCLNNNLYFTMDSPNGLGKDDIYFAEWKNGSYQAPVILNTNINSNGYEFNAFISKDEDFLLYSKYNAKDGFGSGDLYISQNINGVWQKAENLGVRINSKYMDYCPFYDDNTNTLYFTSRRSTIESKAFTSVEDFQSYVKNTPNGLSKIFMVKVSLNKN